MFKTVFISVFCVFVLLFINYGLKLHYQYEEEQKTAKIQKLILNTEKELQRKENDKTQHKWEEEEKSRRMKNLETNIRDIVISSFEDKKNEVRKLGRKLCNNTNFLNKCKNEIVKITNDFESNISEYKKQKLFLEKERNKLKPAYATLMNDFNRMVHIYDKAKFNNVLKTQELVIERDEFKATEWRTMVIYKHIFNSQEFKEELNNLRIDSSDIVFAINSYLNEYRVSTKNFQKFLKSIYSIDKLRNEIIVQIQESKTNKIKELEEEMLLKLETTTNEVMITKIKDKFEKSKKEIEKDTKLKIDSIKTSDQKDMLIAKFAHESDILEKYSRVRSEVNSILMFSKSLAYETFERKIIDIENKIQILSSENEIKLNEVNREISRLNLENQEIIESLEDISYELSNKNPETEIRKLIQYPRIAMKLVSEYEDKLYENYSLKK